jgi:hypothetical protein
MGSIVSLQISDNIMDLPAHEMVRLSVGLQLSVDDGDNEEVPELIPANWTIHIPYSNLNDPDKFQKKLNEVIDPMRIQYFLKGVNELHEAVTRFVLRRDWSEYTKKAFPDVEHRVVQ